MNDLKLIKKYYGENMMHLCRTLFPTIIDKGVLFEILDEKFYRSKELYYDVINYKNNFAYFINYIYEKKYGDKKEKISIKKTPKELLDEAGYILFECHNEREIQSFKKYYAPDESLCTFNGGRLNSCHVFFAVKKNVDEIRRSDFIIPNREDEYGTSVISIQFSKGEHNALSIKNRYNHTVDNPDATFSNNLENIIPGLSESFKNEYNLNFDYNETGFELPNYVMAADGKFYKYNLESQNIYYCPNNLILEEFMPVTKYQGDNASRYILMDSYVLDLKEKRLFEYKKSPVNHDCFTKFFDEHKIENINITKYNNRKKITLIIEGGKEVYIEVDKNNSIISYDNVYLEKIENDFMICNSTLSHINIPNVKIIGNNFLFFNKCLTELDISKVESIGESFLDRNEVLSSIDATNVKKIGSFFLGSNRMLQELNLPKVVKIASMFLNNNRLLKYFNAPNLEEVEALFMENNLNLTTLSLPKLKRLYFNFLLCNKKLESFYAPNLEGIDDGFLKNNRTLKYVDLSSLNIVDSIKVNSMILRNKIREKIGNIVINFIDFYNLKRNNYKLQKNSNKYVHKDLEAKVH